MSMKAHVPLAIAAAAVIATQILCAWSTNAAIRKYSTDEYEIVGAISDLKSDTEEIAKNTKSIDERLMTPGEYLRSR